MTPRRWSDTIAGDRMTCESKGLAPSQPRAIRYFSVMSASVKPRLAGRQPSNRGGVPRVIDQVE